MRTEKRMDQDYDYHMNTGELPEYFGNSGQNNEGCFWLLAICAFIIFCVWKCASSSSDNKERVETTTSEQAVPNQSYAPVSPQPAQLPNQLIQDEQPSVQSEVKPEPKPYVPIKHSTAYEEGYETGYNDGEEDAYTHSGWQASYDDDCKYKGKMKSDYEEGYENGYEAGYDDNTEYDD